ncbi:MAG: transporter substrate-binding domain-containing protein [Alphaproteobacteria bacterium]|nr:transporter substrate-binding domain-containing protein [Alphaproteobacteria bacterium]
MLGPAARGALILVLFGFFTAPSGHTQTLERVAEKGEVVIGVTNTFRPYGYVDDSGGFAGLEIDLANSIAEFLGAKARLVPVAAANRIPWLRQNRIDLILASMPVTEERRAEVGLIDPPYYASGVAVLASAEAGLRAWRDLANRHVCGLRNSAYNRVAERYGATIVPFSTSPEVEEAVLTRRCVGWVFDEATLAGTLSQRPRWAGHTLALVTDEPRPWAIGVPSGEREGPFGQLLSNIVTDWHRSGHLLGLQEKWGLPPNGFLADMNQRLR